MQSISASREAASSATPDRLVVPGGVADLLGRTAAGQGGSSCGPGGSFLGATSSFVKAYGEPELDAVGNPLRTPGSSKKIGGLRAMLALLKAYIGPAILYLPRAWQNGGWLFTSIMLPPLGLICAICVGRLADFRIANGGSPSYGELMESAFGSVGRMASNLSIVSLQSGTCCTYFIFVASIIQRTLLPSYRLEVLIPGQLLVLVPLAWIRQVRRLTVTSLIADVLILGSLVAIFAFEVHRCAEHGLVPRSEPPGDNGSLGPLVALGSLVFAFEGIALVLPIADSLRERRLFQPLMFASIVSTSLVMLLSGSLGYATFGSRTASIVLMNLPTSPGFMTVQFAYALAVVFTFPLQLLPAVRILEASIFAPRQGTVQLAQKAKKSMFRTAYVCILAAIAVVGQTSFDHFVSLIGVVCGVPLAFIYPCLCHYNLGSGWQKALDLTIAVGASIVMVVVATVNIALWVAK